MIIIIVYWKTKIAAISWITKVVEIYEYLLTYININYWITKDATNIKTLRLRVTIALATIYDFLNLLVLLRVRILKNIKTLRLRVTIALATINDFLNLLVLLRVRILNSRDIVLIHGPQVYTTLQISWAIKLIFMLDISISKIAWRSDYWSEKEIEK